MSSHGKIIFLLFLACVFLLTLACGDDDDDDDDNDDDSADDDDDDNDDTSPPAFEVGFARVDVSPDFSVIMGGYGTFFISDSFCRWSTDIHDPIYATAVAFVHPDDGVVIMVHIDAVGVIITDIEPIQNGIAGELGIPTERVLVASSHSHGSPDTVGIWGVMLPPKTGRNDDFIELMIAGSIDAGIAAYESRVPATLEVTTGTEDQLHYNPQRVVDRNAITDDNVSLLAAYDEQDTLIGTLMSWGCHPMIMGPQNTSLTADYPGAYYRIMDEEMGGINMYVNSSLGAAVHPRNPDAPFELEGRNWGTWEDVDNFGRSLADNVQTLLGQTTPLDRYDIELVSKTVTGTLENPVFALMGVLDLIPRDVPPLGGEGESLVTAFSIGDVRFGTVPGELVPNIGLELRQIMGGDHQFVITLGMDWMGYIMTAEQYKSLLYIYFSILSVGPDLGPQVIEVYQDIFGNWPAG